MAPRANWKGFLRLSLVTCPVALYPATSDTEKVYFNQINRKTGHRIKYAKVDADTGEEVANEDIMKGYKVDTDTYIEVTKEELDDIALESTRTIEIDEFVPKTDIDNRYLIRPYYLVPDGKVGHDAFAVIRETIRNMDKVAIGRVVLDQPRAHHRAGTARQGPDGNAVALPLRGARREGIFRRRPGREDHQGHAGSRQAYRRTEVGGHSSPSKFEDHYESALVDLINRKRSGVRSPAKAAPKSGGNVINLMDALEAQPRQREAVRAGRPKAKGKKPGSAPRASAKCCCRSAASAASEAAKSASSQEGREAGRAPRPDRKRRDRCASPRGSAR